MNIQLSLHACRLQIINKIKTKSMLITGPLKSMSAHCDSVHSQNMRDAQFPFGKMPKCKDRNSMQHSALL